MWSTTGSPLPTRTTALCYDGLVYCTGSGSIADIVGDLVAYRSLRPYDDRLAQVDLPVPPPRKHSPEYAQVVGALLRRARALDAPGVPLRRLIVVGDNAASDGAAFTNLCAVHGWEGVAAIVNERTPSEPPRRTDDGRIWLLSHWSQIRWFAEAVGTVDATTVVLLDIDKTLLGARGRNDMVIDQARATAMEAVCGGLLGDHFDRAAFDTAQRTFTTRAYAPLTDDNQDYVAYLCLIAAAGVVRVDQIVQAIDRQAVTAMPDVVQLVERLLPAQSTPFHAAHAEIAARVTAGDPTPFKAFRHREFIETVARMGTTGDVGGVPDLDAELVLTGEVLDVARRWHMMRALIFALSDKPDESALPDDAQQQSGYLPLHRTRARIVDSQGLA